MHADDLAEWLMTIAINAKPDCPIYNVGSDDAISVRDLAILVAQEFSVKTNLPVITEGKIDRYVPSICKAKNNLGLQIKIDLPSAIRLTVNDLIK
jgi:nucleoside-diphosphate-sugar epimerase